MRQFASKHPKWRAIDRAIGKNGLKVVTLLRLSPLLPLAASNWLYGCTRCVGLVCALGFASVWTPRISDQGARRDNGA